MTKIILRSSNPEDEKKNELIKLFLEEVSNKKVEVRDQFYDDRKTDVKIKDFVIDCSSETDEEIKTILHHLNAHRYIPYDNHISVWPNDFDLQIETPNHHLKNTVNELNFKFLEDRVWTLEHIINYQNEEIDKLKEKSESMYNFLFKTNLVEQTKSYDQLLTELDESGLIDKEDFAVRRTTEH